jgi:serine/threonine-protein kinase
VFVVAEKYHVVTLLGSGGMGAVYEALHAGTGRRVAVKLLKHEVATQGSSRERFVREARLAGSLVSPHIAAILDAGTDELSGLPYIVMELVEGPDLRTLLRRRGKLPVGLVLVIAAHVARGLAEAHRADLIHRDVKPANIMLARGRDGELVAKLVDFGIAKAADEDGSLTRTGDFIGSFPYMSPEQLNGRALEPTADLWSLGVVMYEALAGARPTGSAEAIGELVHRICQTDVARLEKVAPWVPPHVAAIVHKALEREPSKRFASARAMEEEIVALLPYGATVRADALDDGSDIAVATGSLPAAPTSAPRVRGRTALGIVALAGTMTVTGVVGVLASSREKPGPVAAAPDAGEAALASSATDASSGTVVVSPSPVPAPASSGASPAAVTPRAAARTAVAPPPFEKASRPAPPSTTGAAPGARGADPLGHM